MESSFQINNVSLIFLLTAFVSLALAFITLSRKDIAGIRYITFISILVFIWTLANALEYATSDLQLKILFTKISYLGITPAPFTFLVFAAQNTGLTEKIPLRYFNFLYIIPAAITLLAFTNDYHYFQWKEYRIIDSIGGKAVYYVSGYGLWILVVFSWIAFVTAMILMIRHFRNRQERYNAPLIMIVTAFTWPWIANVLYVTRVLPHPEIDWTPVAFLLTSIFVLISVMKYKLFELAPLARDLLYTSIQNAVIVLNIKGVVIDFNQEAKTHFHLNPQIGRNIGELLPELSYQSFENVMGDKIPIQRGDSWFELIISEIINKSEQRAGFLLLFNDITTEEIQRQELVKSKEELQQLNASKDKLFSIIAHDLRNPFNGIIGLTHVLLGHRTIPENDRNKIIESIHTTAINTYSLLENLLTWAKAQIDSVVFQPEVLPLTEIVETCANESAGNARLKSIEIITSIPESVNIYGDKNMLTTVIRNLLTNAIKFTPRQGKVVLSYSADENNDIISVIDNGIGIDADKIPILLNSDSFVSSPGTENEKGTGLGLVITQDFVKKHGGKLGIESTPGKGTTFYFTIPKAANLSV
ncbi:MAG: hypothetical protein K9I34_02245 [Bacteroidales bacterium]|nr:hypothetical protein [Bacteroidales bacterium]